MLFVSVLLTSDYAIVTYSDAAKIDYVHFTKKSSGNEKKFEKLSTFDPKV